jgi:hypothetical protein
MKKTTYGFGLLASLLFAVAIADAQSGGGAGGGGAGGGGAGGAGASGSGASGASASGSSSSGASAAGSTGTSSRGSSGLGASSPSNLVTGGAGSSSATGTAAGRTGTGASAFQASPPGSAVTQPGLPGTRQTNPALQGSTFDQPRGLNQQNSLNQSDFSQRSALEQRLIDQQQSAALQTQQGQLGQQPAQYNDQQSLQQRATLGEQQAAGPQGDLRDQSLLRGTTGQSTEQSLVAGTAPGELGVFVAAGPTRGVRVSRIVAGSAAAAAGLQPGDIIVGVGEQPISSPSDLTQMIRAIRAGEVAQLQVLRGDAEYDVDATLLPFRGGQSSSYGVGYRGSEPVASGDLASRVRRLEEQLAMVLDELQTVRRDVVALRGGSSEAGVDARFRDGETRTGMETESGAASTRNGFSTDANDRGPVSGVDASSDTSIDARSSQQRDASAVGTPAAGTDRGATSPSTDDDPLDLDNPPTPPQNEQPASDPALPF